MSDLVFNFGKIEDHLIDPKANISSGNIYIGRKIAEKIKSGKYRVHVILVKEE